MSDGDAVSVATAASSSSSLLPGPSTAQPAADLVGGGGGGGDDEHERRRLQDAANASVELIQGPRSSAVAAGVAPALHSLRRYEGYRKLAEGGDRTFKFTEVCAWEPED